MSFTTKLNVDVNSPLSIESSVAINRGGHISLLRTDAEKLFDKRSLELMIEHIKYDDDDTKFFSVLGIAMIDGGQFALKYSDFSMQLNDFAVKAFPQVNASKQHAAFMIGNAAFFYNHLFDEHLHDNAILHIEHPSKHEIIEEHTKLVDHCINMHTVAICKYAVNQAYMLGISAEEFKHRCIANMELESANRKYER